LQKKRQRHSFYLSRAIYTSVQPDWRNVKDSANSVTGRRGWRPNCSFEFQNDHTRYCVPHFLSAFGQRNVFISKSVARSRL